MIIYYPTKKENPMKNPETAISFISNVPLGQDLFDNQAQEHIAQAITNDLKDKHNKIIGIDGGWGSGKSNIVQMVQGKLNPQEHFFFLYDVWGHQEDLQRKSILWELIEFFECPENKNAIHELDGIKEDVKQITGKTVEKVHKEVPQLSFAIIAMTFYGLTMPILNRLLEITSDDLVKWLIVILFSIAFLCLFVASFLYSWRNVSGHKPKSRIMSTLSHMILLYKGKTTTTKNLEFEHETNPSISSFVKLMCRIALGLNGKTLVIVFDNMDRLPEEKVREFWSSLHTLFVDRIPCEEIRVIIPFNRQHIRTAFSNYGDDYINKTFSIVYQIPPPILSDWKHFFEKKWNEAKIKCSDEEYARVIQAYDILAKEVTPRNIIAFINEFVAIKKQIAENIPDRYIAIFVLCRDKIMYDNKNGKNPQQAILQKNFLGALSFVYQYDNELSRYIAALVYQIPSDTAMEILYAKNLKDALENKNIKSLQEMQNNLSSFNELLDTAFQEIVNPENAAIALGALNQGKLGARRQAKWDELYSLCVNAKSISIDDDCLLESHALLLKNVSDKKGFISLILSNITSQSDEKFNAIGYYDVLKEIKSVIVELELEDVISVNDLIEERLVSAETYLSLLGHAKETCEWTKLYVPSDNLDEFLVKYEMSNLDQCEHISFASKNIFRELPKFYAKLESLMRSSVSNATNFCKILNLLVKFPSKKIMYNLSDSQICSHYNTLGRTGRNCCHFVCMRLAKGRSFVDGSKLFDDVMQRESYECFDLLKENILSYCDWTDILQQLPQMQGYPLYVKLADELIDFPQEKISGDIKKMLPVISEIIAILNLPDSGIILWNKLFNAGIPEIDNSEFEHILPLATIKSFYNVNDTENAEYVKLSNRIHEYFINLSEDDWKVRLLTSDCYGIREFIAAQCKWTTEMILYVKNALCSIMRKNSGIPDKSIWQETIDDITRKQNSAIPIFNSVKDTLLNGEAITNDLFLFFAPWLFKFVDLNTPSDVCRKLLPISLLNSSQAVEILIANSSIVMQIIAAGGEDGVEFKRAIKEKGDEKNIAKLADALEIKLDNK